MLPLGCCCGCDRNDVFRMPGGSGGAFSDLGELLLNHCLIDVRGCMYRLFSFLEFVSGDRAPGSVCMRCKDALIELLFRRAAPSCDRRPDVLPGRVARLCNAGGVDMISRSGCADISRGGVGTSDGMGSRGG